MSMSGVTALAPWFGANRMGGKYVGAELEGCTWVLVPCVGGFSELPYISARTILASDKHRLVINLARVVQADYLRTELVRRLDRTPFHPEVLVAAQSICQTRTVGDVPDLELAYAYFVCAWMGRSGRCGTRDELKGRLSTRWTASGGDSVRRFHSAIRGLVEFVRVLRRCQLDTRDAFELLDECQDVPGNAIYVDPPFPVVGLKYSHSPEGNETDWHRGLRDRVARFQSTRVVLRFYEHELIRELYPEGDWTYVRLTGRDQANNSEKPELLVIRGESRLLKSGGLFQ